MGITVDELLKKRFLNRSREEMHLIVTEGKPRPHLNMAAVVMVNDTDKPEVETRQFSPAMYDQIPWLTGCEKRESVFCWPCLLFTSTGPWSTTGLSDFAHVIEGVAKHEEAVEHITSTLQLKHIVELNSTPSNVNENQYCESVKRNRAILKRLTDVVCNLFMKEQPHYKRKNGCQIIPENCVKNLQFLRNYDVLNCNYIEDAIDLINMSPNIVNDLVDAISELIKQGVRKEICTSTYASLILSDHSEVAAMPQISAVLRYITNGKIHERFVGFSNMGNLKYPAIICQHISNLIDEYELSEKLIAVSIDGGVLSPNELLDLVHNMRNLYPYASFVPWHSHGLDYVLQQSLSNISEFSHFFKTINSLKIYLQKKSKRFKALEGFMSANNSNLGNNKWFVRSQMINTLNSQRKHFILFFESLVQNSHRWSADEIAKAVGFQKILEDFKTVFLLQTFSKLFQRTSALNKILNGRSSENLFNIDAASQLMHTLAKDRDNGFDELWTKTEFEVCVEVLGLQPKRIKMEVKDDKVEKYREMYTLIFNHVIQEIDIRFNDLNRLKFCHLLKFNQCVDFTNDMLQQLMIVHDPQLDEEQVRNEIIVLRTNSTVFKDKSVYDMLQFFLQSNLKSTFKCIHKLTQFLSTLPIKPTSADGDTPKLQDVIDWSYVPVETGVTSGDVAIPCVELDFLQELKKSNSFHDDVFENFQKVTKNFELLLK